MKKKFCWFCLWCQMLSGLILVCTGIGALLHGQFVPFLMLSLYGAGLSASLAMIIFQKNMKGVYLNAALLLVYLLAALIIGTVSRSMIFSSVSLILGGIVGTALSTLVLYLLAKGYLSSGSARRWQTGSLNTKLLNSFLSSIGSSLEQTGSGSQGYQSELQTTPVPETELSYSESSAGPSTGEAVSSREFRNRSFNEYVTNEELEKLASEASLEARRMKVDLDLYKELEIDRAWDEKQIKRHLKTMQKIWKNRKGTTNDKEQKMRISAIEDMIEKAFTTLTRAAKRAVYDQALALAYKTGAIVDQFEEEMLTLLEQAKAYYYKGNYRAAIQIIQEAVDARVNNPEAYELLARSYYETNQFTSALESIDLGLDLFKENLYLHWLGARMAADGPADFGQAQSRINQMLELNPNHTPAHCEQVYLYLKQGDEQKAFERIDGYMQDHPEDEQFKRESAYNVLHYANGYYHYDPVEDATFIADKNAYKKILDLSTKAQEIYQDEFTAYSLEHAKYYGQREWNSWNMDSIKSLSLYGVLFFAMGATGAAAFSAVGLLCLVMVALLTYFSFRPYWQINYTYVTGKTGALETTLNTVGSKMSVLVKNLFFLVWKAVFAFLRLCWGIATGMLFR